MNKTKKIAVGAERWDLIDETTAVEYFDVLTELRSANDTVHLSLGTGINDANQEGLVKVTHRLRCNMTTARFLHSLLGDILANVDKAAERKPH
ncbi:hypothetical protein J2X72_001112 [Phyllobacterium sp. 1468]|uniref:hypothetical protein n=1 Tax=Phyllobacterium sp. 1468 TaxID=2817759 RepID=UPI002865FEAB|nr:hypothetical protein [Phyllobacterium sp. 1468]MDR6632328.1 hypothetical protein [Phyllobacterium sp. 1468]